MFMSQDRAELRQVYITAWHKRCHGLPLEPLETLVAGVIALHPEYHKMLSNAESAREQDFQPEGGQTNPFLHMGLHIAVAEQCATHRPAGINEIYQTLVLKHGDAHTAEHVIMESIAEMLWQAQRDNTLPDENTYLRHLREQVRDT
ncbi:MAG: hypothetical protein FD130_94 [Halothiobacillaceae bacterium]|nr:MAG: hypothetical protein FD130_94 [Halothiobacillaceae bacterium]